MSGLLHTSFQTDPPVVGQGSATDPSDRELGVHSFQVLISGHIIHVQLPLLPFFLLFRIAMAFTLVAMASNPVAMASNLIAVASNPIAMASN